MSHPLVDALRCVTTDRRTEAEKRRDHIRSVISGWLIVGGLLGILVFAIIGFFFTICWLFS